MMAPTLLSALCVETLPLNQLNEPLVLLTTFNTMPRVVDLPLPLGPSIPYTFPFSMVNDRSFTAVRWPNFFVKWFTERIVSKIGLVFALFMVI